MQGEKSNLTNTLHTNGQNSKREIRKLKIGILMLSGDVREPLEFGKPIPPFSAISFFERLGRQLRAGTSPFSFTAHSEFSLSEVVFILLFLLLAPSQCLAYSASARAWFLLIDIPSPTLSLVVERPLFLPSNFVQ